MDITLDEAIKILYKVGNLDLNDLEFSDKLEFLSAYYDFAVRIKHLTDKYCEEPSVGKKIVYLAKME